MRLLCRVLSIPAFCLAFAGEALSWSPPVTLQTGSWNTKYLWQAQIDPASGGGVHAVFSADWLPRYVRFRDAAFGPVRTLPAGNVSDVTESGDGRVHAVLTRSAGFYEPVHVALASSADGGASWTETYVRQCPDLGPNRRELNEEPMVIGSGTPGSSDLLITSITAAQTLHGNPPDQYWRSDWTNLYFRHFDGTSWGPFSPIPDAFIGSWTSPTYQKGILFRSLQDNSINRVYAQYSNGEFQFCNYRWNGSSWGPKEVLFTSTGFPGSISMAISPNGYRMLVYTSDVLRYRVYTPGSGWGPEGVVDSPSSGGKVAAIPGTDDFIVAYWQGWSVTSQVFTRVYSGGRFLPRVQINPTAPTPHAFCDIAVAPNGDVHVAYVRRTGEDAWELNIVSDDSPALPRGTLTGRVTDQYGAGVQGALVRSGACFTFTGPGGSYSLSIGAGVREVTASKPHYESSTRSGVVITAGQTTTLDLTLRAEAPAPVESFTATASDRRVTLTWTNPPSGNFAGTRIVCSTAAHPAGPFDGILLADVAGPPGAQASFSHRNLTNGVTWYYAAFAYTADGHFSEPARATGAPRPVSCGEAKLMPPGLQFDIRGKVVTGVFPSDGCFYIQDGDRSSGIRVAGSGTGLAPGDRVDVTDATVSVFRPNGVQPSEMQLSGAVTRVAAGPEPVPLAMTCQAVGGGWLGSLVPGSRGGTGLNNIGLLATVTGRVTAVISTLVYVDDGSNVQDTSGRIGVAVRCPSTPSVSPGQWVRATGVIRGSIPTGWTENRRFIVLRKAADLTVLNGP